MTKRYFISWALQALLSIIAILALWFYFRTDYTRAKLEARDRQFEQLSLALERVDVGFWEWDFKTDALRWSSGLYHAYGIDESIVPSYDNWLALLHEKDRQLAHEICSRAAETGEPYLMTYRVRTAKGDYRLIKESAAIDLDDGLMIGTVLESPFGPGAE